MKNYMTKEETNILHIIKRRKADWNGQILPRNCLLKHSAEGKTEGYKWLEDKEEYVNSYSVPLRKQEGTLNGKMTHWIALYG